MVHTVCTTEQSEAFDHFQRLWRLLLCSDIDLGNKLERLFAYETGEFDLDYAFLSRIDSAANTEHFERVHAGHGHLDEGNTVPLSTTYCRKTIEDPDGTLAISDAVAEGWADDPAYEKFEIGSYVGTVVTSEGELYGTLCFANTAPRTDPITDAEVTLVEMYGRWASYELNRWTGPPTGQRAVEDVAGRDVVSGRIDVMMDALSEPIRRSVLLELLDGPGELHLSSLQRTIDADEISILLHHTHLPKLEQAGYIEWNPNTATVSRGSNFVELEPLLRYLEGFATDQAE